MPKSRRRKSTSKNIPLVRAKNVVRGAKDPAAALLRAIQSLPKSDLSTFFNWAEQAKFGQQAVLADPFPRQPRSLLTAQVPQPGEFNEELEALTTRLTFYAPRLKQFQTQKNVLETAVLAGDYERCQKILSEIENSFGYSLWLIEIKIAVVAMRSGLEAQKRLAEEIRAACKESMITATAYYVSQRNEPNISPLRFIARMHHLIDKAQIKAFTKLYYKFHLTRHIDTEIEAMQSLILRESTASLIDAYETFAVLALENAAARIGLPVKEISDAIASQRILRDIRFEKLRFLADQCEASRLLTRDLTLDHALLKGDNAPLTRSATDIHDPRLIWVEAIYRALVAQPISEADSPQRELVKVVLSLLLRASDAEEAIGAMQKWALNFKVSSLITALSNFVSDLSSDSAPFGRKPHYSAALNSPYLDPWDLPFVPDESRRRYLEAIVERYGETPLVQFVSWLCGFGDNQLIIDVSPQFQLLGNTYRSFNTGAYAEAASFALELEKIPAFRAIAIRWHCNALLGQNLEREAIRYCACRLAESSEYYSILPIGRLLDGKKWKDLRTFANEIGLAVLLDIQWRHTGNSELNSFRRYAAEDFLSSRKLRKPSELDPKTSEIEQLTFVYFLSNVCSPEVLELMMTFPSSRSAQEERRAICAVLTEFDPANAVSYRNEMTRITSTLVLEDGVRLLDQSRVFVDTEGVVRWAERELKESFDRYRALQNAGVGFDREEFAVALRNFLVHQHPLPGQFLTLPKGEADELFLDIISALRSNFLLSPTHGLDSYLSLRVRHATLSGMLRGPLEQHYIINQRTSGTTKYQSNSYWRETLKGVVAEQISAIEEAIIRFSEGYDGAIDELRNRLQIRRKEKPDGLFDIPLTSLDVYILRSSIAPETRLDSFVRRCVHFYWTYLDESLNSVQSYMSHDFRNSIAKLFETLETELQTATSGARYLLLNEAVRQAKTEVQTVLEIIKSWFQRGPASKLTYPIGQAVDVAIEVVRTTYRNFDPKITKDIPADEEVFVTSVTAISDIIFTALDNVYRHSGIQKSPEVLVEVKRHDAHSYTLAVENELSPDFDYEKGAQQIRAAQERISRSEYKTAAVSAEGGTGLLKLKGFVNRSGDRSDALTFGFTANRRFRVSVVIEAAA